MERKFNCCSGECLNEEIFMRRVSFLILFLVVFCVIFLCSCELMYEPPTQGDVHILVYGNDYAFLSPQNHLHATLNDAVSVGLALSKLCEKTGRYYDCTYLYGLGTQYDSKIESSNTNYNQYHDVTDAKIKSELHKLQSSAKDGDMTFIYFSGHGTDTSVLFSDPDMVSYGTDVTKKVCLVTRSSKDESKASLVSVRELLDLIEAIPGTKIVFSDFCYSGAMVEPGNVSWSSNEYKDINPFSFYSVHSEIKEKSSMFCLSASSYFKVSYEDGPEDLNAHGFFTSTLLYGLGYYEDGNIRTGKAVFNKKITFHGLAQYIENDPTLKEHNQHPMYNGGSSDIILFEF